MSDEPDFLEVDQSIPGQNYVCLSFISPEKMIKQKEVFFMKKFLHELLTNKDKRKYLLEMDPKDLTYEKVESMVEDFRIVNERQVDEEFTELVDFQTNVRGVKIRGVYDTLKEAKIRCEILQKRDRRFNVFLGQVGYWLPWDPTNLENVDSEYQEKQLNELMKNYQINQQERDMFYEQEKQERVNKAIEENLKRKKENIEKGEIDPEKEPKEDSAKNIGELRDILDEKDKLYNQILKESSSTKSGGTQQAAVTGDDSVTENTSKIEEVKPDEVKPDDEFTSNGHADPWMRRKVEGEEKIEVVENKETVTHNAEEVTGQTDENLKSVVENIF